jgi:NarL family two-component system response regulator LiaR
VILIHADDGVRAALADQLDESGDIDVVASVRRPEPGVTALAAQPDAVVLTEQPELDGLGRAPVLDALQGAAERARIVVMVDAIEPTSVIAAMRSGATSILRSDFAELARAVQLTAGRVGVIDADALAVFAGTLTESPRHPLSARERDVLACLAGGASNAEIAERLYVSRETVKSHVASVLRKLEVEDRRAAVDKAAKLGLLL